MRILSLGAGVQSTTVLLLAAAKEIEPVEYAIFADTQEEPRAVYEHLEWLKTFSVPILTGTAGKLGDDLLAGRNSRGGRFASIPAFTHDHHDRPRSACGRGMARRQCTKEYKVDVVESVIRRQILELKPRQRIPKGVTIRQLIGISWDERKRADRIRSRMEGRKWAVPEFPLIDMKWTRTDCEDYLKARVPHQVPRSACVFCPYKSAKEWLDTKNDPEAWARAVEIDETLRRDGVVVNRNMDKALYLHSQCIPLRLVDIEAEAEKEKSRKATPLLDLMCDEGMCGR